MNRRDFVKALAGIPLLGLLVKVPEAKDPYHEVDVLTFDGASHRQEDWYIADPESEWHTMVYEGNRLISDDDPNDLFEAGQAEPPNGVYTYIGDTEPFSATTPSNNISVLMWWNGEEYIRVV